MIRFLGFVGRNFKSFLNSLWKAVFRYWSSKQLRQQLEAQFQELTRERERALEALARDVLGAHELRLNVNENMSSIMTQIDELDAFLVSFHADHDLTKLEIPTRLVDDSGKFPDAELMSSAERKSFAQRRLHGLCLDLGRALFTSNISGVGELSSAKRIRSLAREIDQVRAQLKSFAP